MLSGKAFKKLFGSCLVLVLQRGKGEVQKKPKGEDCFRTHRITYIKELNKYMSDTIKKNKTIHVSYFQYFL